MSSDLHKYFIFCCALVLGWIEMKLKWMNLPVRNCCLPHHTNFFPSASLAPLSCLPHLTPLPFSSPSLFWTSAPEKVNSCSSACRAPSFQLWMRDWNGNGNGRESRLRSSNTCTASWLAHQLRRKATWDGRWVGDGSEEEKCRKQS